MTPVQLPEVPAPIEIDWPTLNSHALGCGVEDRGLRGRYECAEYGWQDGVDMAASRVPDDIYTFDQLNKYAIDAVMLERDRLLRRLHLLAADLQQSATADGQIGLRAMCIDARNRILAIITPSETNSER